MANGLLLEINEDFCVHADSSTGLELKAVEEACREASRTVEAFLGFFSKVRTVQWLLFVC